MEVAVRHIPLGTCASHHPIVIIKAQRGDYVHFSSLDETGVTNHLSETFDSLLAQKRQQTNKATYSAIASSEL